MSAPKRQRVSKARKGPDPGTPPLDQLVDSPLPFLVGFHQDGSIPFPWPSQLVQQQPLWTAATFHLAEQSTRQPRPHLQQAAEVGALHQLLHHRVALLVQPRAAQLQALLHHVGAAGLGLGGVAERW